MTTFHNNNLPRYIGPIIGTISTMDTPEEGGGTQEIFHRVRTARLKYEVSLRSAARQMGSDIRSLRLLEQETTDLRLSDLHKWQKVLDVPMTELIEENDEPLSRLVMERALVIRLMKTAASIHERVPVDMQSMAERFVHTLV